MWVSIKRTYAQKLSDVRTKVVGCVQLAARSVQGEGITRQNGYVSHINGAEWRHRLYKALFEALVPTVSVLLTLTLTLTLILYNNITIG